MDMRLIVVLVFIAVMIVMAVMYRKSTLDKLAALQGEEVLFEEPGLRVEQAGAPEITVFINSLVRVTNHRIVIAQKTLLGNKYPLRHVITYDRMKRDTDLSETLKKGYITMEIDKSLVKVHDGTEGATVTIQIPDSALTRGQYITFRTSRAADYRKIFG